MVVGDKVGEVPRGDTVNRAIRAAHERIDAGQVDGAHRTTRGVHVPRGRIRITPDQDIHDIGDVKYFLPPGATLAAQLAQIGSGWHFLNGMTITMPDSSTWTLENCRGKYFVGFDDRGTADADYDKLGVAKNTNTWTGFKGHGPGENNHLAHYIDHHHERNDALNRILKDGGDHADNDGDPTWNADPASPGDGLLPVENDSAAEHSATDNRPPSCVVFALIWIGKPTVNGLESVS